MIRVMTLPIAFGFYLLLAGALGTEQLVSAGVMAIVTLAWSQTVRRSGSDRSYSFGAGHVRPWVRAVAKIPADTFRIGAATVRAALFGGSPGRAMHPHFHFGIRGDPRDAARRATAIVAGSLTPDAFIVDIAPGRSQALCHKLSPSPAPDDAEWLV